MAKIEQVLFIDGALNSDTALNKLPQGHSRSILNARIGVTNAGNDGNGENVRGNTLISYTLPTGTNKVIGSFEERERNRLFYFIHNASDNHSIVYYDGDSGTVIEIIESSILAFDLDFLITGIAVVEDRLYWVEGSNNQRKINIEKADFNKFAVIHMAMSYALGASTQLSVEIFDPNLVSVFTANNFYQTPPSTPGTIQSQVYDEIIYELNQLSIDAFATLVNCGDFIEVTMVNTGHYTMTFTNNDPNNTGDFAPKRSKAILTNMYDQPYTNDMINLIKKPPLDQIELGNSNEQITYVNNTEDTNPRSFDPDLQAKNFQFSYRYIYDDGEVSVLSAYSKLSSASTPATDPDAILLKLEDDYIFNGDGLNMINFLEVLVRESNDFPWGTLVELSPAQIVNWDFRYEFGNEKVYPVVDPLDAARLFDAVPNFSRTLEVKDNRIFLDDAEQGIDCPCINLSVRMNIIEGPETAGEMTGAPFRSITFMRPAEYKFGIAYYDFADRKTTVCTDEEAAISTPNFADDLTDLTNVVPDTPNAREGLIDMIFDVKSFEIPPEATHYQLLMSEQLSYADYDAAAVESIVFFRADKTTVTTWLGVGIDEPEYMEITIDWNVFNDTPPNSNLEWIWEEGDFLRFLQRDTYAWYNETPAVEIESSSAVNSYLVAIPTAISPPSAEPLRESTVRFERYGKASTDVIYFEMGEKYNISNYSTNTGASQETYIRHEGGDQNQAITDAKRYDSDGGFLRIITDSIFELNLLEWLIGNEIFVNGGQSFTFQGYHTITGVTATTITLATVFAGGITSHDMIVNQYAKTTVSEGDMYRRKRNMIDASAPTTPKLILTYSSRWEDNVPYNAWSQGRINVFAPEIGKSERGHSIRFSNKAFEDTEINGMSTFEGLNFKDLTKDYGNIRKLIRVENRLLCICESETLSLFIEENVYQQTAGDPTVVVSDEVIGYSNLLEGGAGTKHPESVVEESGHVFFFDIEKGYVIRYTSAGLFPISENFMRTFFRNKSNAIRGNNVKVYGGYDRFFKEYIIAFEGSPGVTLGFHEKGEKWRSFYSYEPDFIGRLDQDILTWKDGALHRHNVNAVHNNFYGVQFTTQYRVVFKGDIPDAVKYWISLAITSNGNWSAPEIDIPATDPGGVAMSSRLLSTTFKRKENALWASFKRDLNTPNAPSTTEGLLNGRKLRGLTVDVLIESTDTTAISFSSVDVFYNHSEKTKK